MPTHQLSPRIAINALDARFYFAFAIFLNGSGCPGDLPSIQSTDGSSETTAIIDNDATTTTTGDDVTSGNGETDPQPDTTCGNGIVDAPEECDLSAINGTGMYCTDDCTVNVCGDGYVGPGEACDDGNENDADQCTSLCGLATCGDDNVQAGEECDAGNQNSETGECLPSCLEATCGDTFIHEGVETCDGNNVGTATCQGEGFSAGVLVCADNCMEYDTSNCYACGDGSIDKGENCDGENLASHTCQSQGFDDGILVCSVSCTFDTADCYDCGDGSIDPGEECEGANLAGHTCQTRGFDGGVLMCSADCSFDTSGCHECGDGNIDPGEECEGAQLGGGTCQDLAMPGDTASGGMPACNASCMLIEGTCTFCGDGIIEGAEVCDLNQLGGATCATVIGAGSTGLLWCSNSCTGYNGDCCLLAGMDCSSSYNCCSGYYDEFEEYCL
jgi:cysteine-rich repeat protein